MIAVTKIGSTVISMHVYDDHRIVVAQVSPGGQDYDYRTTHHDLQEAHDAYLSLITSAVAGRWLADRPRLREDRAYAAQQRARQRAMQEAAHQLPAHLFGKVDPEAAVRRWLQDRADVSRESAALWEER